MIEIQKTEEAAHVEEKDCTVLQMIFVIVTFTLAGLAGEVYAQDKWQAPVKAVPQTLSTPEIIDALVSFPGSDSPGLGAGPCLRAISFGEIVLMCLGA